MMTLERFKQITDEMVNKPSLFAAEGYKYFIEALPNLEKQLFPQVKPKVIEKPVVKPTAIEKKKKKKKSW